MSDYLAIFDFTSRSVSQTGWDVTIPLAGVAGDTVNRWGDAKVALAQATLQVTPTTPGEMLPFANDAGHVVVGDIRLDNREALFAALAIPQPERARIGDGALVLAAYARWGADCADHLLGDFAYAIWDPKESRLVCSTDAFALRRFFYHVDNGRFLLASNPTLIAAVPGVPSRPNTAKLDWAVDIAALELSNDQSWYAGIETVGGATTMVVHGSGKLSRRRYWEPSAGEPLVFRNDDAFREAFQALFFESVQCRLRSNTPVTAMLSGGLDSSSIVAVAAKILERENKQLDVVSVVLPDPHEPVLTDERAYIDLFRTFPNVRINYIHADGMGPFSNIAGLDWSNGPMHTSRHYNYSAMERRCVELGSRVLLDGSFGELGATSHVEGYHAELFAGLRWPALWRELAATRALTGKRVRQQIRQHVVKPLLPRGLLSLFADRRNVNVGGLGIFAPDFEAKAGERLAQTRGNGFTPAPGRSHRAYQLEMLKSRQRRGTARPVGSAPLEYRFPFIDKRLLQFCLDAPASFKQRDGYNRSLVRIGLKGILPPEIERRTTKTGFSPDYMRRYNRQAADAVRLLEEIGQGDPVRTVIDVDKVLSYARATTTDDEPDALKVQDAMHRVPLAIYTIAFLRQFAEFRA